MPQDDHDLGLSHDLHTLRRMTERRRVLGWMLGATLLPALGCTSDSAATTSGSTTGGGGSGEGATTTGTDTTSTTGGTTTAGGASGDGSTTDPGTCSKIPEETAGPYPGDGSNGANALVLAGIVRSDIRSSFAGVSGTAAGIPLTVKLKVVSTNGGCASLAGYAVYLWHCDRDGNYSMYTVADQNYLRGVQETDADGTVTFTTTFPGCYPGRWPHIHFEIYPSLAAATAAGSKVATSQLALPQDACSAVYATTGYETSVTNLTETSLASDMVFSDGSTLQV